MKNGATYKITAEKADGTIRRGYEFLKFTTARGRKRSENAAMNRALGCGYTRVEVEQVGPTCSGF